MVLKPNIAGHSANTHATVSTDSRLWQVAGTELAYDTPLLVAILNRTPDSFSDGAQLDDLHTAIDVAAQMIRDGADILDVGGESTRPGAGEVSVGEELERVGPLIEALAARFDTPVSVDTRRAKVAAVALESGACIVNDVSGFGDPGMGAVVRDYRAGWVLMHMPHAVGAMGWSEPVMAMPAGVDEGREVVAAHLRTVVERAEQAGVSRAQIAVDPGVGFGKSARQNLGFLRHFGPIANLGLPVFMGPSRKSFIGQVTGQPAAQRLMGTAAAVTACVLAGAAMLRVHDVAQMRGVIDVATAIRRADGADANFGVKT